MDKVRENNVVEETGQRNTERKLPYEKPKLTPVSLFADQVLAGCTKQYPNDFCVSNGTNQTS